jgi:hypothetical protein
MTSEVFLLLYSPIATDDRSQKKEQTHFLFLLFFLVLLLVLHKNLEKQNKSLNFAAKTGTEKTKLLVQNTKPKQNQKKKKNSLNFAAKHMNRKSKQSF